MSQRKARRTRQAVPAEPTPSRGEAGRNLKRVAIFSVALLVAAAVVTAAVLRSGGSGATVASAPGDPAPSLDGTDPITGEEVSLSDFAGKPVVVNIWASWCPGCNDEALDLATLASAHPEAQVIGIDYQDTSAGARAFYGRWGWRHPSIFDPDGRLASRLGLVGLPMTVFLDAQHRVVSRIVGAGTLIDFESGLRHALAS